MSMALINREEYEEQKELGVTDKAILESRGLKAHELKALKKDWGILRKSVTVMKAVETNGGERKASEQDELRWLVDMYVQAQKIRIQCGNRAVALVDGADDSETRQFSFLRELETSYKDVEDRIFGRMNETLKTHPLYPWLKSVKGIGPTLGTKLLGLGIDIHKADTVSKLWRFAGYATIDGEAEKMVKGEQAHYNKRLKTTLYLVATSFMKLGSPYRRIYDEARAQYEKTKPDWSDGHKHMAAMRKMNKVFLQHLWIIWRTLEGLPTRSLYAQEYLGHTSYYDPQDFCEWKIPAPKA